MAFRADCNSMRDSAKTTVSSAYSNKYNFKYTDNSSLLSIKKNMCRIANICQTIVCM